MKLFRWIYYSFMAIVFIAGIYSGLRVFFIVFLTQLLTVISVLAISLWTIKTFKFRQELSPKSCVKGKEVTLQLEIANERPFPLSLIEVRVEVVSYGENVQLVFSVAPYSGRTFNIPIATPYRGRYNVGMTKLKITDIFGLISFPFDMRWFSYYRMPELIVLPKAQMPAAVSYDIPDTKLFGDAYLKQAEQGDSVSGVRLYHPGDSLRRVHWKKSAQQSEIFIKQYEYPEKERVLIFVDTGTHGLTGEDALIYADTVCECAACIALHNLSQNRAVRVVNSADFSRPAECAELADFERVRRYLAVLPFSDKAGLYGMLAKIGRDFSAHAIFVLTRIADKDGMLKLEKALAPYNSVTLVAVGGVKPGGRLHTLYVEVGANAAESLQSLF